MGTRQSFVTVAQSTAPPDTVFAVVADGAGWSRWAGPFVRMSEWEREGDPPPDGVGAIRRLGTRRFHSREEILVHAPPRHLAYTILSGQPVRDYRADVLLEPVDGGTRITWRGSFEPSIPGTGTVMRWWLRALVGSFARRLARTTS